MDLSGREPPAVALLVGPGPVGDPLLTVERERDAVRPEADAPCQLGADPVAARRRPVDLGEVPEALVGGPDPQTLGRGESLRTRRLDLVVARRPRVSGRLHRHRHGNGDPLGFDLRLLRTLDLFGLLVDGLGQVQQLETPEVRRAVALPWIHAEGGGADDARVDGDEHQMQHRRDRESDAARPTLPGPEPTEPGRDRVGPVVGVVGAHANVLTAPEGAVPPDFSRGARRGGPPPPPAVRPRP